MDTILFNPEPTTYSARDLRLERWLVGNPRRVCRNVEEWLVRLDQRVHKLPKEELERRIVLCALLASGASLGVFAQSRLARWSSRAAFAGSMFSAGYLLNQLLALRRVEVDLLDRELKPLLEEEMGGHEYFMHRD